MSKLSFRARQLDASKPMPVLKADEIPDMPDFAAINRAVPQMPTGMEKEEESEHHLQRALSAQQVYGTAEKLVIPIPDIQDVGERYYNMYAQKTREFKQAKQYIHVQPFGMDQEIPDYDMDSEDESWLNKQAKNLKMEVTPLKFENMMDRLEKGSGQTVVSLQDAKALLKEDDDLIIAVYDYWLNKRLRLQHPLIPCVKTEKRDGSTTNNPYVAFRRRTEKMQTRKNRKNDEASYEKMLKLRRDLHKALTILEMMKRREKSKKELLQLTIEIVDKRYQMADWDAKALAEALSQRHKLPSFLPMPNQYMAREWGHKEETGFVRKKREYKKRKHKQASQQATSAASLQQPTVQIPQYSELETLQPDAFSSEDEGLSPPHSMSDHETDDDPDGIYAFRRKAGCIYHAPIMDGLGNWPWCGQDEGGFGDKRYRYSLGSISQPRRCLGYVRRRIGRGGRVILDRGYSDWDEGIAEMDLSSPASPLSSQPPYTTYIKDHKIPHFRPRTPTEDDQSQGGGGSSGGGSIGPYNILRVDPLSPLPPLTTEFSAENFHTHQEQLLQMQQQQQEDLLRRERDSIEGSTGLDLESSFSSQPTSRFTLDSASAQFAASAVCSSANELLRPTASPLLPMDGVSPVPTQTSTALTFPGEPAQTVSLLSGGSVASGSNSSSTNMGVSNGPIVDSKSSCFSTSPAANVLQLNFPLTPSTPLDSINTNNTPVTNCSPLTTADQALILSTPQSLLSSASSLSSSSVLSSSLLATPISSSSSSLPLGINATTITTPAIATKVMTPGTPPVLKIASTPGNKNNTMPVGNHETVANLVQDKVVAMEVT